MSNLSPAPRKWDWDLAFAMYCGGLSLEEIAMHEKFRGIPPSTLRTAVSRQDWNGRRERLARLPQASAVDSAAKQLQDRLKTEGMRHQEFMLVELERERGVFTRRSKRQEEQYERLQALEKLDAMGRRISKLDEEKAANPVNQNFQFLVHLQANTPRNGSEASVGILRSNNAHLEGVDTPDFMPNYEIEPAGATITLEPGELKPMPPPGSLFGTAPISPK